MFRGKVRLVAILIIPNLIWLLFGCSAFGVNKVKTNGVQEGIELDERVESKAGGYSLLAIKGYEIRESKGVITMFPPAGDRQSGPGVVFSSEKFDQKVDLKTAMDVFLKGQSEYQFDTPEAITVDGSDGLTLNYSFTYHALDGVILDHPGASEGDNIKGKVIMVILQDFRLIKANFYTPEKIYSTFEPVFEDILRSIRFHNSII